MGFTASVSSNAGVRRGSGFAGGALRGVQFRQGMSVVPSPGYRLSGAAGGSDLKERA